MSSFTIDELRCQHCDGKNLIRHLPFLGSNLEYDADEKRDVERRKESEGTKNVEVQLCEEGCEIFPEHNIWCRTLHDDLEEWFYCKDCLASHVRCSKCYAKDSKAKKGGVPSVQLCRFVGFCGTYLDPKSGKDVAGRKTRWTYRLPSPELLELQKGCEALAGEVALMVKTGKDTAERLSIPFNHSSLGEEQMKVYYADLRRNDHVGTLECYLGDLKMYYADSDAARMLLTGEDGGNSSCWMCSRCDATYLCTDK